jgi:hypothetical protein
MATPEVAELPIMMMRAVKVVDLICYQSFFDPFLTWILALGINSIYNSCIFRVKFIVLHKYILQ